MKITFLTLVIFCMILLPLNAESYKLTTSTPLKSHKYHIEIYFYCHNINIKTKSYSGWIRVLLSSTKRKQYHLDLSLTQIELYIKELNTLKDKKIQGKL